MTHPVSRRHIHIGSGSDVGNGIHGGINALSEHPQDSSMGKGNLKLVLNRGKQNKANPEL